MAARSLQQSGATVVGARNRTERPAAAVPKNSAAQSPASPVGTLSNALMKTAECRALAERIARDVRESTGQSIRQLCVEVDVDRVRLSGNCSTFYSKQLAQHAAIDGAGQRSISNEIEVN